MKIRFPKIRHFAAAVLAFLAIGLSGCGVFGTSETWRRVTAIHVEGKGVNEQSRSYADEFHRRLAALGIPSKVVTFRYSARDVELRTFTQSVVIYKDKATPAYPYWLVGNMTSTPVWLPNADVREQIAFATGRFPEIIDVDEPGTRPSASAARSAGKWDALFRKKHGTAFNPLSAVDRRKMAALKEASTR